MDNLFELQASFARALRGADATAFEALIAADGLSAAERTAIYRNNRRATFRGAMLLGFPAVHRLVGPDYFRQLVTGYQDAHPSRSGNLQHVGAAFADWLRARFDDSRFAYLADVAAVEWAYQEVLVAVDAEPIALTKFAAFAEEDYAQLQLASHPAARWVESRFPVARIWRANREETLDDAPIDLDAGGERILLLRRALAVEIHPLTAADAAFLRAVAAGEPLGAALEAAASADGADDPAPLLAKFVALGVIVDAVLPAPRHGDTTD